LFLSRGPFSVCSGPLFVPCGGGGLWVFVPLFVHTSLHHLVSTSFVFLQAIMAIAKEKCWLGLNLICLAITFNKMLMK
jgi:cadmium resistance protein CadD (predicted permease)